MDVILLLQNKVQVSGVCSGGQGSSKHAIGMRYRDLVRWVCAGPLPGVTYV
jgi:hypothetical protein